MLDFILIAITWIPCFTIPLGGFITLTGVIGILFTLKNPKGDGFQAMKKQTYLGLLLLIIGAVIWGLIALYKS